MFSLHSKHKKYWNVHEILDLGEPSDLILYDEIPPPINVLCVPPHLWTVPREIKFWKILTKIWDEIPNIFWKSDTVSSHKIAIDT